MLMALNSPWRSEKAVISVGHTKVKLEEAGGRREGGGQGKGGSVRGLAGRMGKVLRCCQLAVAVRDSCDSVGHANVKLEGGRRQAGNTPQLAGQGGEKEGCVSWWVWQGGA